MRRGLILLLVVLVATALVAVDPDYLLRQIEKGNAGDRSDQEAQETTLRVEARPWRQYAREHQQLHGLQTSLP